MLYAHERESNCDLGDHSSRDEVREDKSISQRTRAWHSSWRSPSLCNQLLHPKSSRISITKFKDQSDRESEFTYYEEHITAKENVQANGVNNATCLILLMHEKCLVFGVWEALEASVWIPQGVLAGSIDWNGMYICATAMIARMHEPVLKLWLPRREEEGRPFLGREAGVSFERPV